MTTSSALHINDIVNVRLGRALEALERLQVRFDLPSVATLHRDVVIAHESVTMARTAIAQGEVEIAACLAGDGAKALERVITAGKATKLDRLAAVEVKALIDRTAGLAEALVEL